MSNFTVEYYTSIDGKRPAEDFIMSQPTKMRAKILRSLRMLAEQGNALRLPFSENLDDGIFELRTKQGSDITRILYFFFIGNKAILTNGFVKKTQKTPPSEILLAKKYRDDFIKRTGDDKQ